MKSAEQLIIEHEKARGVVSSLKAERLGLMAECDRITDEQFGLRVSDGCCYASAWSEFQDIVSEGVSFLEVIEESDSVCSNCLQAYKLKVGPLADARKVFGNAKRAISARGKKLGA